MSPKAEMQTARRPRIICIIEARFNATRLPGKVLMPILGEPVLGAVFYRPAVARTPLAVARWLLPVAR